MIYFCNSLGNVGQGVFIKYFVKNQIALNLYEFLCLRCLISVILLLPFNIKNLKKYFTFSNKFFFLNIIISCFYSVDILLWNKGLQTIPVNNGTIIMLLIPIWITILSRVLLKEKDFSVFHLFSFVLGFIGVVFSIEGEVSFLTYNSGNLLILLNTFVVAIGLILQKQYRHERPVGYSLFLNAAVCLVLFFIINHFQSAAYSSVRLNNVFDYIWNKKILIMALAIAVLDILEYAAVYFAYSIYNVASLQPVRFTRIIVSGALSYLFLNEHLTLHQFIAINIIVLANLIVPIAKLSRKKSALKK
jgi:drug/metabolite transporter (DMT)-like permease